MEGREAGVGGEKLASEAEGLESGAGVACAKGCVVVCLVLGENDEIEGCGLVVYLGKSWEGKGQEAGDGRETHGHNGSLG